MPPSPNRRPPSLCPAEVERDAIACVDDEGDLHWVRVFEAPPILKRRNGRLLHSRGRRLETPAGSPVRDRGDGTYDLFSEIEMEWVAVKAVRLG